MSRKEKIEALKDALIEDYLQCERSLSHYIKASWDVLEPETPLQWNWHVDLISEYLTAVHLGQIQRLIINVPPRTMKSLSATVCFPTWTWLHKPANRFLFGSYADTLAKKHSLLRRNLIESDWFQDYWGHRFQLAEDQNVKTNFNNNKTGQMFSTGILSAVTGEGGDYVMIDDPHNPKKAESDAERSAALTAFDLSWSTRLNDKKTGRIIIIMQRLHDQDLTGHLLAKNAGYVHLKIPQVAEKKIIYMLPISKLEIVREPGTLLHPDRDGQKEVNQAKLDLGSYGFAGQQQQEPAPAGGGMLKRKWWKFYKVLPDKFDDSLISMDTTFKDSDNADFVVGQAWGRVSANKYLIDQMRDRMDFVTAVKALEIFSAKHKTISLKLVEDKANGTAIMNMLQDKLPGLVAYNPKTSKIQRVAACSPEIEAGNIWLPDPSIAPWINDFIEECSKFPMASHDDQVDAMTQALLRFRENPSGTFTESVVDSEEDQIGGSDEW